MLVAGRSCYHGRPISLAFFERDNRSRPLRVTGNIGSTEVGVLIDTGSTHDFLHPRIAERLRLSLTPIHPFPVYVGNGASLLCSHVSRRTKLTMQGVQFLVDLHILEVHGAVVILGMDWLESLGKISADFVGETLEFQQGDKSIVLKGDQPGPQQLSLHSLMLLVSYSPAHEFYEIVPLESEPGSCRPPRQPFHLNCRRILERCWRLINRYFLCR